MRACTCTHTHAHTHTHFHICVNYKHVGQSVNTHMKKQNHGAANTHVHAVTHKHMHSHTHTHTHTSSRVSAVRDMNNVCSLPLLHTRPLLVWQTNLLTLGAASHSDGLNRAWKVRTHMAMLNTRCVRRMLAETHVALMPGGICPCPLCALCQGTPQYCLTAAPLTD